jgi:hypothetical protein
MIHRVLFNFAVSIFLMAVAFRVIAVRRQDGLMTVKVGTPACEPFESNGLPATKCARTRCTTPGDAFENYISCTPDPFTQDKQMCETKPFDCSIVSPIKCNNSTTISYGYTCPDINRDKSFTATITCPVDCRKQSPCPTPTSPKPSTNCRWDTTHCTWECDFVADGCLTQGFAGGCLPGYEPVDGWCCPSGGRGHRRQLPRLLQPAFMR